MTLESDEVAGLSVSHIFATVLSLLKCSIAKKITGNILVSAL